MGSLLTSKPTDKEAFKEPYLRLTDFFNFKLAFSDNDKKHFYKLRHEVFCQELSYKMNILNGVEQDDYDHSSIHCIIEHKHTGITAGGLRVITLDSSLEKPASKLPIEEQYKNKLPEFIIEIPRKNICEASRLVISRHFREGLTYNHEPFIKDEKSTFPYLIIGLFLSSYAIAELFNKQHMFAMMEPTLPRLLRKYGFNFIKVGDPIHYHGIREPYYIDNSTASNGMAKKLLPLYREIHAQLNCSKTELSTTI
jgi:N-acyl amino acid synthase of PEP-CTERM/exosortase system